MTIFGRATRLATFEHRADDYIDEYLHHTNSRTISAFFLGWVCMASLYYITSSIVIRDLLRKACHALKPSSWRTREGLAERDPEAPLDQAMTVKANSWTAADSIRRKHDSSSLIFTLNLCFIFSAIAYFLSLLTFGSHSGWDTGCAFVVAWGGMASHSARLVGILILFLRIPRNTINRWEGWLTWLGLFIALVFVFATNALSTGTTSIVNSINTVMCYRRFNLPVSLTSSIFNMVLEFYIAARLISLDLPPRPRWRDFYDAVLCQDIGRAFSLFVLDLLTIVPDATPTNLVAQFVPFGIGALLVLAVFNYQTLAVRSFPTIRSEKTATIINFPAPPPTAYPFLSIDPMSPESSGVSPTDRHRQDLRQSVQAFTARSSRTFDSEMVVSVEGAVVSTAVRQMALQGLPPMPHSAPAQLQLGNPSFPPATFQRRGHILPFQTQYAEQLEQQERHDARIVSGLVVRPLAHRPQISIVVCNDLSESESQPATATKTPGSAIFGSDIIRPTGRSRRADKKLSSTISADANSYTYSHRDSIDTRYTRQRESFASTHYLSSPSERYPNDSRFSTVSRGTSRGKSAASASGSFLKSPWDVVQRYSIASIRTKSREDLPTLRENESSDPIDVSRQHSHRNRSRRTTFGQSLRRSRSTKDMVLSLQTPTEPVPPIPLHLSPRPPILQLLAPDNETSVRSTSTSAGSSPHRSPQSHSVISLPPPSGRDQVTSPGRLRGPRPPPSAFLPGTSWPGRDDGIADVRLSSSRSDSYPVEDQLV